MKWHFVQGSMESHQIEFWLPLLKKNLSPSPLILKRPPFLLLLPLPSRLPLEVNWKPLTTPGYSKSRIKCEKLCKISHFRSYLPSDHEIISSDLLRTSLQFGRVLQFEKVLLSLLNNRAGCVPMHEFYNLKINFKTKVHCIYYMLNFVPVDNEF